MTPEQLAERITGRFYDDQTYSLQQMKPFANADGSVILNGGNAWSYGLFMQEIAAVLREHLEKKE